MRRRDMLALAAAAGAAACGREAGGGGKARIRFATDWRAQAEHGGFYQALATGAYARRGLEVEIIQGGPGVNVPQLLAAGAVELGMGSNAFIAMNLAAEGAPVKAVAAFFQKDPQVLIAHPDPALRSIADLKGRPILLADASVGAFWVWLKAKYGFTDGQVRKYTFNSAPFLADPRAVQQGYLTSEPYTIETEAGFAPRVFLLADEGYPSYACMVLAPTRMIEAAPQTVRAFVEATAEGWRGYLEGDPAPADALIRKDNPEMSPALLAQAREKLVAYGVVLGGDAATAGPGVMSDARWEEFHRVTSEQGVYPKTLDWRSTYTLDFAGAR